MSIATKIVKDGTDGYCEYCVQLFIDGEHIEDADYFTEDKEDAKFTALDMRIRAKNNKI